MSFCKVCGKELPEGNMFCPSCGASVTASVAATPAAAPAGGGAVAVAVADTSAAQPMATNVAGALAYLAGFITGIIFMATEPYKSNSFIRFHAFQSIFLNVAMLAVYIVLGIFSAILMHIIPLLGILFTLAYAVMGLGFFCLWLFLIYKAYNKEKFLLPIIGPMAEKQANS